MSIAATLQLRRGLAANVGSAAPADGEPLWTTDTHALYVGQGGTAYPISGAASPLTTKGDVWAFSTADARLPVGSNGQVLSADSSTATGLKWVTAGAGLTSPLTTKGDLWAFTTADARLGVGSDAWVLQADSTQASGLRWGLLATNSLANNVVTYAKLQQETGPSVIGRAANTPGDQGAIAGTADQVLRVNSAGTTLTFGQVNLASSSAVTGVLASANLPTVPESKGGTNQTTYALGDVLYASAANTLAKLAGNTTATRKFLRQTGNGTVSAAPAWDTIVAGDLPTIASNAGGTGFTTYAKGDLIHASATSTLAKLAIGTTGQFLWVTGGDVAWRTIGLPDVAGYGCVLTDSTTQTITNNVWTSVTWDTETTDDAAFHSTASNTSRVTVPSGFDGLYLITFSVLFATGTTGARFGRIFKNGATVLAQMGGWGFGTGASNAIVNVSAVARLVATDYVEGQVKHLEGANLNANVTHDGSFSVAYLGK